MFEGRDVGAELKETWRITRLSAWRAVIEFYEADNLTYAASIAYYALLSLFPFALITVSILGSVTADDRRGRKCCCSRCAISGAVRFHHHQLDAFRQNPIRLGVGGAIRSCGARSACSARSARRSTTRGASKRHAASGATGCFRS